MLPSAISRAPVATFSAAPLICTMVFGERIAHLPHGVQKARIVAGARMSIRNDEIALGDLAGDMRDIRPGRRQSCVECCDS